MFADPMWPMVAVFIVVIPLLLLGFFLLDKLFPSKEPPLKGFMVALEVQDKDGSDFAIILEKFLREQGCNISVLEISQNNTCDILLSGCIQRSQTRRDHYYANIGYYHWGNRDRVIGTYINNDVLPNLAVDCGKDLVVKYQKWDKSVLDFFKFRK